MNASDFATALFRHLVEHERTGVEDLVQIGRALCDHCRAKIVLELSAAERCVGELVERSGLSQTTVSHHLSLLHNLGFAQRRRGGRNAFYSLSETRDIPALAVNS